MEGKTVILYAYIHRVFMHIWVCTDHLPNRDVLLLIVIYALTNYLSCICHVSPRDTQSCQHTRCPCCLFVPEPTIPKQTCTKSDYLFRTTAYLGPRRRRTKATTAPLLRGMYDSREPMRRLEHPERCTNWSVDRTGDLYAGGTCYMSGEWPHCKHNLTMIVQEMMENCICADEGCERDSNWGRRFAPLCCL